MVDQNMSMSMLIDRPSVENKVNLKSIKPMTWIPDTRVHHCFKCSCEFSWFNRKHHCRSCGRIFCHSCSSYMVKPPKYSKLEYKELRMCAECARSNRESLEIE